jgi:type IV secretion system protein VirB10
MAGTRLRVQFDSATGTATSREGDGVAVQLIKPVEAEGREVLPVGTVLSGRVVAVHKGNKHTKIYPMIRLAFHRLRLPDGRSFPVEASLADLGVSESVDSEGVASTVPNTKAGDIAVPATMGAAGAGIGAIAGGGKGAGEGAAIGAGIGILADLAERAGQWQDFTLKKGRKAWLRLDEDLALESPTAASTPDEPALRKPKDANRRSEDLQTRKRAQ